MIGKTFERKYIPQTVKRELKTLEEQIAHAAGAGKKTFTDERGQEHKISEEMRYFAKEAREGGHTLTRKSEVKKMAEGFVETAREEGIHLRSGLNIGSDREVAGKIVKEEEAGLAPEKPRYSSEQKHIEHLRVKEEMLARIGIPGHSQSTGSMAPAPTIEVKPVQPIAPGSVNAPGPTKATSAGHPVGLMSTNPYFGGGRHTDVDNPAPEPTVVAPTTDSIAGENQTVAESIPPAQDVDLPDTSSVDKGLPF